VVAGSGARVIEKSDQVVRTNPLDAYRDAILYGTGVWRMDAGEAAATAPEPATDPYEVDTP